MKVLANNPWVRRTFESVSEAAAHFGVVESVITNAIESGEAVGIGVRYWTFDEALQAFGLIIL